MAEIEEALDAQRQVAKDVVGFRGHPNVLSTHPTTIEVTTETHLTRRGDCIIGVGASKGCAQLGDRVKDGLRRKGSKVTMRLVVGGREFRVNASGDPRLDLSHPHDMVIRKSDFVSDRTLAVCADAASKDIPREMVLMLRNQETAGRLEIEVT